MIENIELVKGHTVTISFIKTKLHSAKSTFNYARFKFYDGTFLNIVFHRDQTIDIMTNSRNLLLWTQINVLRKTYTMMRLTEFTFRWVNQFNK